MCNRVYWSILHHIVRRYMRRRRKYRSTSLGDIRREELVWGTMVEEKDI